MPPHPSHQIKKNCDKGMKKKRSNVVNVQLHLPNLIRQKVCVINTKSFLIFITKNGMRVLERSTPIAPKVASAPGGTL